MVPRPSEALAQCLARSMLRVRPGEQAPPHSIDSCFPLGKHPCLSPPGRLPLVLRVALGDRSAGVVGGVSEPTTVFFP